MTNFVIHGDLYHMDREFKHKTLHGKKKKVKCEQIKDFGNENIIRNNSLYGW